MKKPISQSESKILNVIWLESPLDSKQIAARVEGTSWSYATVKTLINRLLKKGYLVFEKTGRRYLYSASITKSEYLQHENSQFLERMYAGSFSNLIASFCGQEKINKDELEEIKAIIEQLELKE